MSSFKNPALAKIERAARPVVNKVRPVVRRAARFAYSKARKTGLGKRLEPKIKAKNVVWIFGSGRSGTTWLANMFEDLSGHVVWHEPMVATLFGYYNRVVEAKRQSPSFVMGPQVRQKAAWMRLIRAFVLDVSGATFPEEARKDHKLVVKEPHGGQGATVLMEALPESRMLFIVRDPRDIMASWKDADRGTWGGRANPENRANWKEVPVKQRARQYMTNIRNVKEAYEAHKGRKVLVRYEDLRAEPLVEMRRVAAELELGVPDEELTRVVEKRVWENIPRDQKGEGKFYRKAKPGGWREDLTPEEIEDVETITAPILEEYYGHRG